MRLLRRPLGGSRLVRDYLNDVPSASAFYRGSPFRVATYRAKAEKLDAITGPEAIARAATAIRPVGPAAERALRAVGRQPGFFVTTGQQPGLFGGPLYSLYKALTAVRLAETLAAALGRPVMPLFWIASEDHDWEEANHAYVVDGSNALRRIALDGGPGSARPPLFRVRLGEAVRAAAEQLTRYFPPNDFRARYVDLIDDAYRPSATMAEAFAALMTALLRDTPLGLVDAADPALKEASRPLLRAEAEDPVGAAAAVGHCCDDLTARGYALQVPHLPDATNLFVDGTGGRERLMHADAAFSLRGSGRTIPRAEVLALIEGEPRRVSPNVLLRPVVESFVFPTLAYVGGPGELAYFGQLRGLFRHHGVDMPVATPRGSLLALETKVAKVLDKYGLEIDDLQHANAVLTRFARNRVPAEVREAVAGWRSAVASFAATMERSATRIDPVLKGAVTKARNSGLAAVAGLEKKVVRAVKRNDELARNQIAKAQVNLWPAGKPQDRVLGPFQYLMRYGPHFVPTALNRIRLELDAEKP